MLFTHYATEYFGTIMASKKVTELEKTTRFFWERWRRAVQMDMSNKINGEPTHYLVQATEWSDAFRNTLSAKDAKSFDHYWGTLEDELDFYHTKATDKERNKLNPMRIP